jgi:hypothetical protein
MLKNNKVSKTVEIDITKDIIELVENKLNNCKENERIVYGYNKELFKKVIFEFNNKYSEEYIQSLTNTIFRINEIINIYYDIKDIRFIEEDCGKIIDVVESEEYEVFIGDDAKKETYSNICMICKIFNLNVKSLNSYNEKLEYYKNKIP